VAVKLTLDPAQIAPEGLAAIEHVGVRFGLTVMVMVFAVAVVAVKHVPPVTVISQVTSLPLARVVVVYVFVAPF